MQSRKRTLSAPDNGTGALFEYLENYQRLGLTDACKEIIKLKKDAIGIWDDIGIWVNQNGRWRHDTNAELRFQKLNFKDESACKLIVTQLYGLSQAEYEKIRMSFDQELWKSWAGIYKAIGRHKPTFALVVKLPANKIGAGGIAGLAGAAGLIAIAGTQYKANQNLTAQLAVKTKEHDDATKMHSKALADSAAREQELLAQVKSLQENEKKVQMIAAGHAAELQENEVKRSKTIGAKAATAGTAAGVAALQLGKKTGDAALNVAGSAAAALHGAGNAMGGIMGLIQKSNKTENKKK
jgi:hypothetical protein